MNDTKWRNGSYTASTGEQIMRRLYIGYLIVVALSFAAVLVTYLTTTTSDSPFSNYELVSTLFTVAGLGSIGGGFLLFIGCLTYWCYRLVRRNVRGKVIDDFTPVKTHCQKILSVIDVIVILSIGAVCTYLLTLVLLEIPKVIVRNRLRIAEDELRAIEKACEKLLSDASRNHLADLFDDLDAMFAKYGGDMAAWSAVIPEVLRKGRDANVPLKPEIRDVIGTAYLDVHDDPWGSPYQFYIPIPGSTLRPTAPGQTPAHPGQFLYVWSPGRDGMSSIVFVKLPPRLPSPQTWPPPGSGSDDIHNWESYHSYRHFYYLMYPPPIDPF